MAGSTLTPEVTIITATYNSSATLRLALQSVLAQDFQDFEVWIVGDACTDDSEQVVASLGDRRFNWTNLPRNCGSQSASNNEGLRRACGRYIAYLGHDDLWFPWHLSALVAFIKESSADFVHALVVSIDPGSIGWVLCGPRAGQSYATHYIAPSGWLHRREIIEDCGPWSDPSRLWRGVDEDFSSRAFAAGKKMEFLPQLGVLKFPSPSWRVYSQSAPRPQGTWLDSLRENPREVERTVLLQAVVSLAHRPDPSDMTIPQLLRMMYYRFRVWFDEAYGRDRWPVAPYLRWRFQRHRRRQRIQRGLPPS
jgi:hypothetical protein